MTKTFRTRRGREVHALQQVSFEVPEGEVVGLLGPNGAGKTTTIKCILGLMTPTAGSVRVMGYDPRTRWSEVLRRVSAVLEGSRNVYWRLSARENLEFFTGLHGLSVSRQRPYLRGLLHRFGLSDRADVPVQELSGGFRQKVAVACALALRTPVVFLDEPTLGLDVETAYDLRRLLKELAAEERRTIILSSHDMDVVQDVCRQVIVIRQGRIVAHDTVENLLSLFRTRAYRVALQDGLDDRAEQKLKSRFPAATVARGPRTVVQVVLADSRELYALIDFFREEGLLVDGICQQEPDLEQVFLKLVRGEDRC